jgi:hypothetical protein
MAKTIKVRMQRKANSIADWKQALRYNTVKSSPAVINKVVKVSRAEYDYLRDNLLADNEIVIANKGSMWYDDKWYCIAVTTAEEDEVIVIESEGYDYARYTAIITRAELNDALKG